MQVVTTVGLDIAKSVFQVHGVDAAGQVVIRRQLKRRYVQAARCDPRHGGRRTAASPCKANWQRSTAASGTITGRRR